MDTITSRKNQIITRLRALGADRAARDEAGEFLCDGEKLLHEALLWGAEITTVLWASEPTDEVPGAAHYRVPADLLSYVSPLKNAAGVVFSVRMKEWPRVAPGRTLMLETIQDPGNLGTILRAAEAAGVTGVIMNRETVDVYSPKVVRSTMGAVLRVPFLTVEDLGKCVEGLRAGAFTGGEPVRVLAAHLKGAVDYTAEDYCRPCAVMIGNESRGLSDELADLSDSRILIPMCGSVESLNAAMAATVIAFEAARQRRIKA